MEKMKRDKKKRGYALIGVLGIAILAFLMLVSISGAAPFAYITNYDLKGTVSVIDTSANGGGATISVGRGPVGVAVNPAGTKVYVTNAIESTVSVIDASTNTVIATVNVGVDPNGIAVTPDGNKVYVANRYSNTVSVIDATSNGVTATIDIGRTPEGASNSPSGVAITPDGSKVYVANYAYGLGTVSVIDTSSNTVTNKIFVGQKPQGVAVTPDGSRIYVTNTGSNTVSAVDTSNNNIIATVNVGRNPSGVAMTPDGSKAYVTNPPDNTVSIIDTVTNHVMSTVNVGNWPWGVAITPDGTRAYIVNQQSNSVSIIDTGTNLITSTVSVGVHPIGFGQFIGPLPSQPKLPVANLSSNVTQGFAPLSVQFTDLSENSTSRNWDFENDGIIDSTEEDPIHMYTNPGTYAVNLTAINENGTDSKIATINVLSIPAPTINSIVVPLDPVPVGTSITTSADVTYLGSLSALTAEWTWGDGSTSKPQVSSNFETSHVYNSAGIYTIKLTVTDTDGRSETKEALNYVVVYDPQGGFVTGGGWINSPAGAYVSDKTLTGKATFGFVSKYEKGAIVPTGKTEFQFNVADLNFHSENYDWLVVADSKAKFKGTGTINGEGNYGFMVSAVDGAVDKFRMKIWEKESGNTIYDNEMGTGEDSDPSIAISGGSIIVHKKK